MSVWTDSEMRCFDEIIVFFSFSTFSNPIMHLVYPPKFCIIIVLDFSWDMKLSQEKSKAMPMQIFGG